ncbi:MAG: flagellar M-ring protein FliF [Methylococcales bacterium]|jgi:flagellar M-ring protein FliF|nr:flagellar M-ring protein FliF [Methylococcales bacterium]MBT7442726.1 flagellar M-ring protein FliF [Methylococcales bacterium]
MADSAQAGQQLPIPAADAAAGSMLSPGSLDIEQPTITLSTIKGQPIFRQITMMLAIAASVAIGVSVVMWSQDPVYTALSGVSSDKDVAQVAELLTKAQIEYKINTSTGHISVVANKAHEAKMLLASEGLPRASGTGYELLDQEVPFGTTRFAENSRHRRALEGELARSISLLGNIENARVHLAVPRQSVFIRKRKKPSASVYVKLYPGRALERGQVEAVVHLVSASVPNLETNAITVVDHKGNMLKGAGADDEMVVSTKQLDYKKKIEGNFENSIEALLSSFLGPDGVRAEVSAEVDFTISESTQESYEPDSPAVRSERSVEERSNNNFAAGIPGALSNQPPLTGDAPENAGEGEEAGGNGSSNFRRQTVKNNELDRNVTHTKRSTGEVTRLSVALVVDHKRTLNDKGETIVVPRSKEELLRIEDIAKRAIGFDVGRGDSINVINEAFYEPEPLGDLPELPIWEQSWFMDAVKQGLGALFVLYLVFGLLRPTMKKMVAPVKTKEMLNLEQTQLEQQMVEDQATREKEAAAQEAAAAAEADGQTEEEIEEMFKLESPKTFEMQVKAAREIVKEDPKRVAQVIKKWAGAEEG